ncbi:MAG: class I SAM-dependent methyltransferase [Acidobacteriota bacterium]
MSNARQPRRRRFRVVAFILAALIIFIALAVGSQAVATLQRLTFVEAERDTWQRPDDVIRALDLHPGSSVVDLGCGAGYFSLKLSRSVGDRGKVISVDIRRLPLVFLQVRATLQRRWNIRTQKTDPSPELPAAQDAVLIANTYHELTDRAMVLDQVHRALRPGGRLVILDREVGAPASHSGESSHEVPLATVEADLRAHGFKVVKREVPFVDRPQNEPWWLIVASRS